MQLPKRHKSSWVSLLALATLACSAKSPASLGSLTQNHLLFPLAGLKNWLVRRRSHRVDEQLVASCTRKRLDDDPPSTDRVTVQLFQWRYSDVGDECEAFLGPNGYRYVQVSPPHEHIEGPQWWTDYQPVSYRIGSKRGSEAEFDRMVQRCGGAGVGVIVDVVLNHMSAGSTTEYRRGSSGSSYRKYEYPDLYTRNNFHKCRKRGNLEITNYMNRYEVQNCELVGLADLKTSQRHVQVQLKSYLTRLVDKGVAGFRIDAAKHIPASELLDILKLIPIRVVQEVMYTGGEPIRPEEYSAIGRVHIFQAAYDLKRMFLSDGIAYLGHPVPWGPQWGDGYLPSSHSQIFVTNWDLERNEHGIRIDKDPGAYLLCQVFILTWGYGQVDVFSGYHFSAYDDGPQDPVAQCGRFGWRCEHRHPMVVGAIQLGAAASDQPVHNIITSGAHRLAFSRGSKVFVAINNDDSAWVLRDVVVGLPLPASPEDAYRDRLHPAGEGQLVHLQPDPSSSLARLCPLTIAPRSAIGIMVV
ncbi:hypothetical protein PGT21_028657 [Puccinia graminis f. sp. tritici]|uniref:Alpha-amylase n=2 Tax=Puccinia graminis f. sp. tritici TaxID=56615 RepID=E3K735_PUCGT|nr:uncharacterized protein PGTG_05203 [Puccinia graminis f. sp. tritici CRL 75-36-700-3]EFP79978.2 hypothetical protein PGTG_05203 [Puccinia graminis f. sp. tritici CRL 75-36-700-3]KAA1075865.1 hypothetical protein PGTUg99_023680 [Puccinia graminis f. sp. tritici]KAA1091217.1 hypothetical protein PGT21_028657 [Puccinia graminis f. sp. tritici]